MARSKGAARAAAVRSAVSTRVGRRPDAMPASAINSSVPFVLIYGSVLTK